MFLSLTDCCAPQHYPLYRVSDASCTGQDAAPPEERHLLFREKYDVLSKEASQRVSTLQSGHTTSECFVLYFQACSARYNTVEQPAVRDGCLETAGGDDGDAEADDVSQQQPLSPELDVDLSPQLLQWFKPRLILSGHTHSGCEVLHDNKYPEISVPSFSWRNRNNPSFILVSDND